MPTISSISGTYGYGRSPQNAPTPGIQIYSNFLTGYDRGKVWNFASNGAFIFDANITANAATNSGNCFVITPNSNFTVNVKIWGAGGGSGNGSVTSDFVPDTQIVNSAAYTPNFAEYNQFNRSELGDGAPVSAGGGGAVYGTIELQAGQAYTVFAGGIATGNVQSGAGGGGTASGILLGNIFIASSALEPVAIAGGGGGSPTLRTNNDYTKSKVNYYFLPGAGGGNENGLSTNVTTRLTSNSTSGDLIIKSATTVPLNLTGMKLLDTNELHYWGGLPVAPDGGGGGGYKGGRVSSGGQGNVGIMYTSLQTDGGSFSISSLYDDKDRNGAGDSDHGGRVMIYLDEYKASNLTATGGTVTSVPIPGYSLAYQYHTFTTSGQFVVTSAGKTDNAIDVFVVGGGGGATLEAGGGGGGVAFKSGLGITAGTYQVDVGTGGLKSDIDVSNITRPSGSNAPFAKGGVWGAYKGKPSAFYTNSLSKSGFPDSYIKLINSFGGIIRYINANGDNTDGLTSATGYTTFQTALQRNLNDKRLIVFVVLQGTYSESVGTDGTKLPTPIHDQNKPRIFICAPGKVTIDWTPAASTVQDPYKASPMCQLMHPMSAVYGAIFNRNSFKATDVSPSIVSDLAFFNTTYKGFTAGTQAAIFRGSIYNCVFKEASGDWGMFGTDKLEYMSFTIENCTFVTPSKDVAMTSTGTVQTSDKIVLKNCIFQKSISFSTPTFDNTVQNATIGAKFAVTAHPDKGVYAGDYGWGGAITAPVTGSKSVSIVGHGGGGGTWHTFLGLAQCAGGSGGGSTLPNGRSPATQFNKDANVDYSCYGYAGGSIDYYAAVSIYSNTKYDPFTTFGSSGGGAGFNGSDVILHSGNVIVDGGGVGIEFPARSGIFYGTGGSGRMRGAVTSQIIDTSRVAPGDVGRGGHASDDSNANGKDGIVIVRYIVEGPYTAPVAPDEKNIIAYGGIVTEKLA